MMLEQRQELLSHLKESLTVIHQMYIPSARQPIGYLECPVDHDDNCLPHVRLNNINTSNDVFCSKNECKIVPKKAYMLLLTTVSNRGMYLFQWSQFVCKQCIVVSFISDSSVRGSSKELLETGK